MSLPIRRSQTKSDEELAKQILDIEWFFTFIRLRQDVIDFSSDINDFAFQFIFCVSIHIPNIEIVVAEIDEPKEVLDDL